jgi:hypothetical protein
MERNFYAEATHEAPDGKAVLSNYGRFESVYGQNTSKTVAVGDYTVPLKNNNTMCIVNFSIYKHYFRSI